MRHIDWNNVQAAEPFIGPTPGGYICGILGAEDDPAKEYIRCQYDIIEGEFKNHYRDRLSRNPDFNVPSFIKSYKQKALGFFKKFLEAVEASNPGYKFDDDERKLRGKKVGLVLGEEEFRKQDGSIGVTLRVTDFVSIADIKAGNYVVPKKKTLSGTAAVSSAAPVSTADFEEITDDEDLPF